MDGHRRACGKCGKAGAFFCEGFSKQLWESASRKKLPKATACMRISKVAAFSTGFSFWFFFF